MKLCSVVLLAAGLVFGNVQIGLADELPASPYVQDTTGGWLNTVTHVYAPGPYAWGALWMFSAKHLRVKVESLAAPTLAANLTSQLPNYWQRATLGRGAIEIVDIEYDVHLFAIGGEGISNHKNELVNGRWTSTQYVYESSYSIRATNEGAVIVALHEIGHNWCCEGAGAGTVADPQAYGHYLNINEGMMAVVDDAWAKSHGYTGCPYAWCVSPSQANGLFSARELAAMGLGQ